MDKDYSKIIQSPPITSKKPIPANASVKTYKVPFSHQLEQAIQSSNELILSKHAKERIANRGITITDDQWKNIQSKVNEARSMGVKESLVLLEEAALIVSTKNKTVITALNRQEASSQIFTNIDGTIVI
ncbi:flagellar protein [Bacillus coahuilensis m2-6]|uniref:Flagellar protein n=1 Tax=Bacillus coahuilensis p1.1.43 TaxID=1150625 RepID=A0A147K9S1_9BACI|nr:TIGR02530 family flagellar biosynthesis protein [Bacillus coahuilensis]KUP07113.1 flagellar protein [Bacillus coahuilensis p1.1.43]KUP08670.1 flagellar protein [Bacillus coahuilensis m2-6]